MAGEEREKDLFLFVWHFFPFCTEQLADFAEASVGILGLDSLAPVLAEEHVGGEGTLGGLWVLFGLCGAGGGLFGLFCCLALGEE